MIIDTLSNGNKYTTLNKHFAAAFEYLATTDFTSMEAGRTDLVPGELFAMVSEYQTKDEAGEQMEAHKKYIDIQYVVSGAEKMGVSLYKGQPVSQPYSDEKDFHLFGDKPDYFIQLSAGDFVIFYPNDLHMPTLMIGEPATVKKVVMKISVG